MIISREELAKKEAQLRVYNKKSPFDDRYMNECMSKQKAELVKDIKALKCALNGWRY